MKLNKFFVLLILIINSFQIMPMEQEEEMPSKMEQKEFVGLIQKLPEAIKEEILKYVLSTDPKKIKSGIVFLQKLASTSEFANAVNDPIFLNWAIPNIASKLGVSIVDAAIDLGTNGASVWLAQQVQLDPLLADRVKKDFIEAVKNDNQSLAKFLVSAAKAAGLDVRGEFFKYVNEGNIEKVKFFIDAELLEDLDATERSTGFTALFVATMNENYDLVKLLLDHGADVNFVSPNGLTPLLFATFNDNYEITKLLLDHGANVNYTSPKGATALGNAEFWKNEKMINLLHRHGATK